MDASGDERQKLGADEVEKTSTPEKIPKRVRAPDAGAGGATSSASQPSSQATALVATPTSAVGSMNLMMEETDGWIAHVEDVLNSLDRRWPMFNGDVTYAYPHAAVTNVIAVRCPPEHKA